MKDLIRTDTIFGKRANIVGDISADLVLESLGKIYIKSRNSAKTLEEVILSVALEDINSTASNTVIVEGLENLNKETIKNGALVYDKLSNILYIWLDEELIELINVAPEGTGYVKKTGDTMTGRLTIDVPYGAPLYVNSTDLVKNLNANYLEGESAKSFTRRMKDETILGKWTFRAPTNFESNAKFSSDVLINGSVGTTEFASGFGGYGWRIDGVTNTLTIDNLVVRKMMQVYELVVNKISATNGSLWVTNAGKVTKVLKLPIYSKDDLIEGELDNNSEFVKLLESTDDGGYFIVLPSSPTTSTFTGDSMKYADGSYTPKTTYNTATLRGSYVVYLKDAAAAYQFDYPAETQEEEPELIYKSNTDFSPIQEESNSMYSTYDLFSSDFKFDATIPIIPRNLYNAFKISEEWKEKCLNKGETQTTAVNNAKAEARYDWGTNDFLKAKDIIAFTLPYYKYFAGGDFYIVNFDDDSLPVFKPGDLLRCLKWTYGGIKYYDAVVCNYLTKDGYIIQLAPDINDKTTRVSYDDNLNPTKVECLDIDNSTLYELSDRTSYDEGNTTTIVDTDGNTVTVPAKDSIKGRVEEKDSLVLMGNMWDVLRLNAVYITSTDDAAPYIDVLSGINRPDYSVVYYIPTYKTIKLNISPQVTGIGVTTAAIPYTGDYYVQEDNNKAEYFLGSYEYNGTTYDNVFFPISSNSASITNKIFLSTSPNNYTQLDSILTFYPILTEDDGYLLTEDGNYYLVQEDFDYGLAATSTRTVKTRLGNLDGILDERFPVNKLPYGYGLYGLNVFLVGEFYLSNGKSLAEISDNAITFAIASRDALQNNLDILKDILLNDIDKAKVTLTKNIEALQLKVTNEYYSKTALKTAGMTIINPEVNGHSYPSIALWGNYIMLATSLAELDGTSVPAAMFYKGRIRSKFLEIDEVHNTTPLFKIDGVGSKNLPALNYLNYWTGGTRLYRHTYYINIGTTADPDYLKSCEYIREFTHDGDVSFWAVVDLKGNPILNNGSIRYPSIYNVTSELKAIDSGGIYDKIVSVTIKKVNKDDTTIVCTLNDDFFEAYNAEEDNQGDLHQIISNFKAELSDLYPVLWSLEANGSGNLGGDSFVWDTEGNVTMTGTIYADAGRIGGFNLSSNKMYSRKNVGNDPTYFYLANDTTLPCVFLSTQHSTRNTKGLFTCKSLTFQDYYTSDSSINQVMLNTEGLTWTKSGIKMGAQSIIASIMVMPVWCGNDNDKGMIPYVVVSAADSAFKTVDVCMGWNGWDNPNMGLSVVCFPELDSDISKSAFIANGIRTGKITINVTSLQQIELSEGRYTSVKNLIASRTFNPDTRKYKGSGNSRVGIRNLCFASGSTTFGIPYTGDLRSSFKVRTILQGNEYGSGNYTFYRDKTSDNPIIKNYIELWAGDDSSPNSAGYFINIVYNNYIANTDTYMDLLDIIDSLNSGKTSEEVRAAYESYYNSTLYEYNMWSTNIARLLNKYDESATKYSTQLSNLNTALNNYHDVYDQSDIWYEGNETITTLRSNLEEARQVVSDIYQLEIAKDNWLSKLDSAYELTTELQSVVTTAEYSALLSKYNDFSNQCTYARLNDDWFRSELNTTYRAWATVYSQLEQFYITRELQMTIPQESN